MTSFAGWLSHTKHNGMGMFKCEKNIIQVFLQLDK